MSIAKHLMFMQISIISLAFSSRSYKLYRDIDIFFWVTTKDWLEYSPKRQTSEIIYMQLSVYWLVHMAQRAIPLFVVCIFLFGYSFFFFIKCLMITPVYTKTFRSVYISVPSTLLMVRHADHKMGGLLPYMSNVWVLRGW